MIVGMALASESQHLRALLARRWSYRQPTPDVSARGPWSAESRLDLKALIVAARRRELNDEEQRALAVLAEAERRGLVETRTTTS